MADEHHLLILRSSDWNYWRVRNKILPDFRDADLTGVDLSGIDFEQANLAGAILTRAKFTHAKLIHANLIGANLRSADLHGAILTGAKLNGTDLADAKLNGAKLNGTDLVGAKLGGAEFTGTDLTCTDLSRALGLSRDQIQVARGHTETTKLPKNVAPPDSWILLTGGGKEWNQWRRSEGRQDEPANLRGADLHDADLTYVNLIRANLAYANLARANLAHANLINADLTHANLIGADLSFADLRGADLTNARLKPVNLRGADLRGTNFRGAKWHECQLDLALVGDVQDVVRNASLEAVPWRRSLFGKDWVEYSEVDPRWLTRRDDESLIDRAFEIIMESPVSQPSILRSIEFPPEYHEAGVSILSYFATVLRQRYSDVQPRVTITQEGRMVTMEIETPEGNREQIEQTLDEFGLVVQGKMAIEDFAKDQLQAMELRFQIQSAQNLLGMKNEILAMKDQLIENQRADIEGLRALVGKIAERDVTINVNASPSASSQSGATATLQQAFHLLDHPLSRPASRKRQKPCRRKIVSGSSKPASSSPSWAATRTPEKRVPPFPRPRRFSRTWGTRKASSPKP